MSISSKPHLTFPAIVRNTMWQPIRTAPFDQDLELAVIDGEGTHALVFPCRRALTGWFKSVNRERIEVSPTHWREWHATSGRETDAATHGKRPE
jgi:hypothetical protein